MAGTLTGIDGRQQIWNLGNNMIDTSKLVELELQTLEMKKSPYNNQKQLLTTERNIYASMKKNSVAFCKYLKIYIRLKVMKRKQHYQKKVLLRQRCICDCRNIYRYN